MAFKIIKISPGNVSLEKLNVLPTINTKQPKLANKTPINCEIIKACLFMITFNINTKIGVPNINTAPLIGVVISSPLKNINMLAATPKTLQANILIPCAFQSIFSLLMAKEAIKNNNAAPETLSTINPNPCKKKGMMSFTKL